MLHDGVRAHNPGVSTHGADGARYAHHDRKGSLVGETGASGQAVGSASFGPWGEGLGQGAALQGYKAEWGYLQVPGTELALLGHRLYDPSVGRFLSTDPIRDGRNWYAYGGGYGSPTNFADPTGLQQTTWFQPGIHDPARIGTDHYGQYGWRLEQGPPPWYPTSPMIAGAAAPFAGRFRIGGGFLRVPSGRGSGVAPQARRTSQPAFIPGRWFPHWLKHGHEAGAKSPVEYLKMARAVITRKGVKEHTRKDGSRLFFDPRTGEFVVVGSDGRMRTYFIPTNPHQYWQGQLKK